MRTHPIATEDVAEFHDLIQTLFLHKLLDHSPAARAPSAVLKRVVGEVVDVLPDLDAVIACLCD